MSVNIYLITNKAVEPNMYYVGETKHSISIDIWEKEKYIKEHGYYEGKLVDVFRNN